MFLLKFFVLVIMLTCVIGCAADQASDDLVTSTAPIATSSSDPSSTTTLDTASGCGLAERDSLQARISAQMLALNGGDFEQAREHASMSFKAAFDTESFEEMIRSGFPYLLNRVAVAFGRCRIVGESASLEVRFGEGTANTLMYFFVMERRGWWIDGASPIADSLTNKMTSS